MRKGVDHEFEDPVAQAYASLKVGAKGFVLFCLFYVFYEKSHF